MLQGIIWEKNEKIRNEIFQINLTTCKPKMSEKFPILLNYNGFSKIRRNFFESVILECFSYLDQFLSKL